MTGDPSGDRVPLDRGRLASAARELIAEVGVEKLTMRAAAARLEVTAMALYYHLENRDELLRLVGDEILGVVELPDPDSGDWRELFIMASTVAIDALLEIPGLTAVLLAGEMLPNTQRLVKFCLHQFERGGLNRTAALEVFAGIHTLVLGRLLIEENNHYRLGRAPHPDSELGDYIAKLRSRASFTGALAALVDDRLQFETR